MKKLIIAILTALMINTAVAACPEWECQLGLDDYSCGGYHGSCTTTCTTTCTTYNEYSEYRQYTYCPYCGHEMWDCICSTHQESYMESCGEYLESYGYSSSGSGQNMDHWANIRDCNGNIIGQAGAGDSVEVIGVDGSDSSRVLIYDYSTGTYGSVLSSCVYGGYQWDGSGCSYPATEEYSYTDSADYAYTGYGYVEYTDCNYTENCQTEYTECGYTSCRSADCEQLLALIYRLISLCGYSCR